MAEQKPSLKERLKNDVSKGSFNLSSKDVAEFAKKDEPVEQHTSGPVITEVPASAKADPVLSLDNNQTASSSIKQEMVGELKPLTVTIGQADRDMFIESLISGKRYMRSFSLFNGKVAGTFRCRTLKESYAIMRYLGNQLRAGALETTLEYTTAMRNSLLAAQVMELNGIEYTELHEPLLETQDGTKRLPPGWLEQRAAWEAMPESLVVSVYEELRIFEQKYWTMVEHANDQNFWSPAASS